MPSSPAEDPRFSTWREAIANWDLALEALLRDDLDRVAVLLRRNDAVVAALPRLPAEPPAEALVLAAREAQGRLASAMRNGMDTVQAEMARTRRAQRVVRGYGDPTSGRGSRVEARG